jgi:plastocyanin
MRRLALGACLTLGALTAPAWAATSDVSVANFQFSPSRVDIQPGDTVTWRFAGPDTDHSVTSDPGQAESFDSDPGNSSPLHRLGDTFSHTFTTPGTYTYFCKVHPFMTGRVVVRAPGTADTTPPAVSSLRVRGGRKCARGARRCHGRPTRVSFVLSEAAGVRIAFKRRGGHSPRALKLQGDAGANSVRLSTRRVRPGRYTLTLVATDDAGNRSAPARAHFRVR